MGVDGGDEKKLRNRRQVTKKMSSTTKYTLVMITLYIVSSLNSNVPRVHAFASLPKRVVPVISRNIGSAGITKPPALSHGYHSRRIIPLSSTMTQLHSNLAVSIDKPLLPLLAARRPAKHACQYLLQSLVRHGTTVKIAFVTFLLAFLTTFIITRRPSISIPSITLPSIELPSSFSVALKMARGKVSRLLSFLSPLIKREKEGIPMPFELEGGWGLANLINKEPKGSSFVEYEFGLADKDYVLPLVLGQQLTLCCLDDANDVAQGDFFTFGKTTKGGFKIVCPRDNKDFELGQQRAHFATVLHDQLHVGAEVAIKPGNQTFFYRGPYLPVTDMVYIAAGVGIIPILAQIQSILPSHSRSSVKQVSVLWLNAHESDFDLCFDDLEREFFKYNYKLEVNCVLEDVNKQGWNGMQNNREMGEAVPVFRAGVMAVVSGPATFADAVQSYLRRRQYPEDCICVLP